MKVATLGLFLFAMTAAGPSQACRSGGKTCAAVRPSAGPPSVFTVEPRTVTIQHNRPDLSVEKLFIAAYCLRSDGEWVWDCPQVTVDGQRKDRPFTIPSDDKGLLHVPKISIQFDRRQADIFCVGMKVYFHGIPNERDWYIYEEPKDRYSLLSYCTCDELPKSQATQPRLAHRRVKTFEEFKARLSAPIEVRLKPREK